MTKTITFLFFTIQFFVSAQITDSLKTEVKILSDSTSSFKDSLAVNDSLIIPVKRDSIAPIYSKVLSENSYTITQRDIMQLEYRYTGDYLNLFSLNFIKDLGFPGQPNETFLYGLGNSSISYLVDGISFNERFTNSLNLNLIQSEDVDSIEVLRLPRGFFFGAFPNPVSINFITKDYLPIKPYSRIRYYQGPNRESMIDGKFSLMFTRKLIGSFELTNRIVDSTFINTEYSIWQAKVALKYLLSNEVNIFASYSYNNYDAGYSGGVNLDSIKSLTSNINSVLYDFRTAPVFYPNGELKTTTHLPRLKVLSKPLEWLVSEASFFYLLNRTEQNSYSREYRENKTFGFNLRNDADFNPLKLQVIVDYENTNLFSSLFYIDKQIDSAYYISSSNDLNVFSFSSILSSSFGNGKFIPSIFYKLSNARVSPDASLQNYGSGGTSSGLGIDLNINVMDNLNFYIGYSVIKKTDLQNNTSFLFETGAKFNQQNFSSEIKYFINNYSYGFYTGGIFFDYFSFGDLSGIGADLKFNYWKILIESNSSFYFSSGDKLNGVPDIQTRNGIYFNSLLFQDNLYLKTGFLFTYTGNNNVFTFENGLIEVPSSYKLDFTLAGEIQKTAVIYFLWQNLLGNDYFMTPYYPMPGRSLRFGVAWELFN